VKRFLTNTLASFYLWLIIAWIAIWWLLGDEPWREP
jgi:hypothetical protein